jgi:hypothetical protein
MAAALAAQGAPGEADPNKRTWYLVIVTKREVLLVSDGVEREGNIRTGWIKYGPKKSKFGEPVQIIARVRFDCEAKTQETLLSYTYRAPTNYFAEDTLGPEAQSPRPVTKKSAFAYALATFCAPPRQI